MDDARISVKPAPAPEEAAAIVAALKALREGGGSPERPPSRWELSGRLGRMVPPGRRIEGSPWGLVGWEGKS